MNLCLDFIRLFCFKNNFCSGFYVVFHPAGASLFLLYTSGNYGSWNHIKSDVIRITKNQTVVYAFVWTENLQKLLRKRFNEAKALILTRKLNHTNFPILLIYFQTILIYHATHLTCTVEKLLVSFFHRKCRVYEAVLLERY